MTKRAIAGSTPFSIPAWAQVACFFTQATTPTASMGVDSRPAGGHDHPHQWRSLCAMACISSSQGDSRCPSPTAGRRWPFPVPDAYKRQAGRTLFRCDDRGQGLLF